MDVLAVIPAMRNPDLRPFAGRPLAVHAIEQARAARQVTRVAVVTDDAELSRLALDGGADVVEPPTDSSPASLLRAALDTLAGSDGFAPALAVLVDPAFPLRTAQTIDDAVQHLWRCGADSLVAVCPLANAFWVQDEGGLARPFDRGPTERRYVESTVVAGVRVGPFELTGQVPTGRIVLFEVGALPALRLDDAADWSGPVSLYRQASAARAQALLRGVEFLVLDFDGVMTDNRVLVFEDGREAVICNRGDGLGLETLRKAGVPLAVISKEVNPVVAARCNKLKIPYEQGVEDKLGVLQRVASERGIDLAAVAFMGNDVNDAECMTAAGVAIAPADAHPSALRIADIVTVSAGGLGAVREVCDLILAARQDGTNSTAD
jgi:YrbI family 3-deoxy-D-manno-octulosonate 8-phosphate phosphatase